MTGWKPCRYGNGLPCRTTARFALHKERVQRLVSALCGSRFGRGVVVPGGVSALPLLPPAQIRTETDKLSRAVTADADALMGTSSFMDRLRGTGPLTPARARQHGALGPIGKASGFADDARLARPYDGYPSLTLPPAPAHTAGDAQSPLKTHCEPAGGRAVGWAEAPQGEVLYDVELAGGRVARCQPRSASFHNLVLMHEVFTGDILTDFPFIEASFGLSVAGVAL